MFSENKAAVSLPVVVTEGLLHAPHTGSAAQQPAGFRSPVRAVRSSRRYAVNIDIWFDAQDGLVLPLGRHLLPTVNDVGGVVLV